MIVSSHPPTAMDIGALAAGWKGIEESQEVSVLVNDMPTADQDAVRAKLAAHDVVFVTKRDMPGFHPPHSILKLFFPTLSFILSDRLTLCN